MLSISHTSRSDVHITRMHLRLPGSAARGRVSCTSPRETIYITEPKKSFAIASATSAAASPGVELCGTRKKGGRVSNRQPLLCYLIIRFILQLDIAWPPRAGTLCASCALSLSLSHSSISFYTFASRVQSQRRVLIQFFSRSAAAAAAPLPVPVCRYFFRSRASTSQAGSSGAVGTLEKNLYF